MGYILAVSAGLIGDLPPCILPACNGSEELAADSLPVSVPAMVKEFPSEGLGRPVARDVLAASGLWPVVTKEPSFASSDRSICCMTEGPGFCDDSPYRMVLRTELTGRIRLLLSRDSVVACRPSKYSTVVSSGRARLMPNHPPAVKAIVAPNHIQNTRMNLVAKIPVVGSKAGLAVKAYAVVAAIRTNQKGVATTAAQNTCLAGVALG